MFDLKWSYTDSVDEFNGLVEGQYYNHFRNSRELTSKNGLLINFKNCGDYGLDPFAFFPRAYDLGNAAERDDFVTEYDRTTCFIVLKKHVLYLKKRRPKLV
jgi:tubulin monoglycylase TTLL3/8